MTATAEPSSNESLRQVLADTRTIAVVGIKDDAAEDAQRVPRYMQAHGYQIRPVNPKLDRVLGERATSSLGGVEGPIDLVNLFRAADHIPGHVDEILAMSPRPKAVWMQLGIVHGGAAAKLRNAGITVIQDRCIMVDHRRLLG
jgi:predicted CoA-binding protein